MLGGREALQTAAHLGDNDLGDAMADAGDGDKVYADNTIEMLVHLDVLRLILAVGARFVLERRQRRLLVSPIGTDGAVGALNFGITGGELPGVEVEEFQGLLQHEQMLCPPGAGQGQGDLCRVLVTTRVAQGG